MTKEETDSYIELLRIVEDDTKFLAEMAKMIAAQVTKTRDRIGKLREKTNGGQ